MYGRSAAIRALSTAESILEIFESDFNTMVPFSLLMTLNRAPSPMVSSALASYLAVRVPPLSSAMVTSSGVIFVTCPVNVWPSFRFEKSMVPVEPVPAVASVLPVSTVRPMPD